MSFDQPEQTPQASSETPTLGTPTGFADGPTTVWAAPAAPTAEEKLRSLAKLRDEALVEKLFTDIGPRFAARSGGYTRILKMEERPGDSAPMALMQLVDKAAAVAAPEADKAE